jgi:hypothetical protein
MLLLYEYIYSVCVWIREGVATVLVAEWPLVYNLYQGGGGVSGPRPTLYRASPQPDRLTTNKERVLKVLSYIYSRFAVADNIQPAAAHTIIKQIEATKQLTL